MNLRKIFQVIAGSRGKVLVDGMYHSLDGGKSWKLNKGFPEGPDLLPEIDPDTGAVLDAAAFDGSVAGISLSLIAGILALILIIVLLIVSLLPLFRPIPPQSVLPLADTQANFPDDASLSDLRKSASPSKDAGGEGDFGKTPASAPVSPVPANEASSLSQRFVDETGDSVAGRSNVPNDAALQRQRLRTILGSDDVSVYNGLVDQHKQQIQKTGRDPGSSGFFPQGKESK